MISLDEFVVRNTIILFLWIEYLFETYLGIRQYNTANRAKNVPSELKNVMDQEFFSKPREYALAKLRYGFVKDFCFIIITTIVLHQGLLSVFWKYSESINPFFDEISTSCLWLTILSFLSKIIELPFTIYHTFVLEEKFGFNKQTAAFFIWDNIKAFIVIQLITVMISSIAIVIIKNGGDYFFVWLWAALSVISLVLLIIYPALIAPLFDKYTPLPEGELRSDIEALASSLKFPLTQLYVVEGSKRSSHSNAYFYGLFKSKRIVLFDTLLAKDDGTGCQNDEILAVLSHELGHWSKNHTIKNLVIIEVNLFLLFLAFSFMFKYELLYRAVGFYNIQPVLVGLYVVLQCVMTPYNSLLSFVMTVLSRKFEFEADDFAVQLKRGEPLKQALVKLNLDNLGFPVHDWLYSAWHYSHPPLLQRLLAIQQGIEKLEAKKK